MPTVSERKLMLAHYTSEIPRLVLATIPKDESFLMIPVRRRERSSGYAHWKNRLNKRVYLLADGKHTEIDLARLLHKSLFSIHHALGMLFFTRSIDIEIKHKENMMPLNPDLLRATLDYVAPHEESNQFLNAYYHNRRQAFTDVFYGRLRVESQEVDNLFSARGTDMREQGKRLFQTLWYIVGGLQTNDQSLPQKIQELGMRHHGYGVKPWMYPVVGKVLLESFEEFLGPAWTPQMQESWAAAYDLASSVILTATEEH